MNNYKYLLTSLLLALGLLLAVACNAADPAPAPVDNTATTDTTTTDTTVEQPTTDEPGSTDQPADNDLTLLPRLTESAGGGVGGGFDTAAPAAESMAAEGGGVDSMIMRAYDPFSGTLFTLDTALPTEPTQGLVWRQPERNASAERAAAIAAQFGFNTPLYQEAISPEILRAEPAADAATSDMVQPAYIPTMPYYAFNGDEQLIITANSIFYANNAVVTDFNTAVPSDMAKSAAEAFLQQRGLLTFEYVVEEAYPGQVNFKRVVNGQPLNQPEIYVTVNNNGEVNYVSYELFDGLAELGNYPLISAQQAWELLQSGVMSNNIPFEFINTDMVGGDAVVTYEDPYAGEYKFWTREYSAGDVVKLYAYPQAYLPVNSDVAPRVQVNNFIVSGTPEQLQGIADAIGQQFIIEGTLGADGKTLELSNWQPVDYVEPLYLEGMVDVMDDGSVLLYTIDGQTYIVPDAPADLTDDLEVFVFAWSAEQTDAAYPVLAWENIEKRINYALEEPVIEEPFVPEEPIDMFSGYAGVSITEVSLGYYLTYQYAYTDDGMPMYDAPPVIIQPVWRFTGTITGGDPAGLENVTFYVQAVDPAYLGEAPQG